MVHFTTPLIYGYRFFFETFSYTMSGSMLDCIKTECDTEIWLLGKYHLVISNERKFTKLCEKGIPNEANVYKRTESTGDISGD